MLEIQKFLATATTDELTAQLGIHVKTHPVYPELLHFSYDQFESPKDHPLVQECRGLILNSKDNWKVVAFPFRRFANHGEGWLAPIDWTNVRVQEKVDGSLMIFWYYGGTWNVSTKGSPDAGGDVGDFNFTFAELFWKTLEGYLGFDCTMNTSPSAFFSTDYTYMMELTSIYNRVVCSYGQKTRLTLIGVRDIGEFPYPEKTLDYGPMTRNYNPLIPPVKEYPLNTVDDILKAAEALDPIANEGFVVVDKLFSRCKIKSPAYVMIHHLKEGFGQRRMIRLIQLGEESEVLSYFPEYVEEFNKIKDLIDAKLAEIDADFLRIKGIETQKDFAAEATKTPHADVLFHLRAAPDSTARAVVLHGKKLVNKGTAEVFRYSEDKIERMIGLREKAAVFSGTE